MRNCVAFSISALLSAALVGCGGSSGPHPSGTGPFDSRGNYVEAWADNPSKWKETPAAPEEPEEPEPPMIVQNDPQPRPQITESPAPAPQPKPKPKPKPKPQAVYHTVRKGDTLYGLAKRYGTTVGKIQSANGISGSLIRLGQRLKIPR